MVVAAMVGWVVHGDFANAAINMFQNGTNCTKDLHISNKSSTFAYGFHIRIWIYGDFGTLRSDCVGCFVVYFA